MQLQAPVVQREVRIDLKFRRLQSASGWRPLVKGLLIGRRMIVVLLEEALDFSQVILMPAGPQAGEKFKFACREDRHREPLAHAACGVCAMMRAALVSGPMRRQPPSALAA
jgi:hypothetical protein